MAVEEYLKILRQGVEAWNDWREMNPEVLQPDLSGAFLYRHNLRRVNLSKANLARANLAQADLRRANLSGVYLYEAFINGADLRYADLSGAILPEAKLGDADLRGANLTGATLAGADLDLADLQGANLSGADLSKAHLIETNLHNANLSGSLVYGASVWNIKVNDRTKQQNLVITPRDETAITLDNIKVAQFIYLLLNNQEISDVIDTITSKAVLILGRFSEKRKPILDAIRNELRKHQYLPIQFDFKPAKHQTTLGTIKTLASMARFVIADLTDARSVLMELEAIVPAFPLVAVRLMIKKSAHEYGMLDEIRSSRSVVEGTYEYKNLEELISSIKKNIVLPAEAKVKELRQRQ
jgi:uncharacterized protein YjbI with pentapeptide repeats